MTFEELRKYQAQRDRRFNRAWWALFLFGCLGAFVTTAAADGFMVTPWLILGGLGGMIVGRRQHERRIAQTDTLADAKAKRAEDAEARIARDLAAMAREADQAKRAIEPQAQAGQNDSADDDTP